MKALGLVTFVLFAALVLVQPVRGDPREGRGLVTAGAHFSTARPMARSASPVPVRFHPGMIAVRPRINFQPNYPTIRPSYRALPEVRAQVRAQRLMMRRAAGVQAQYFSTRSTSTSSWSGNVNQRRDASDNPARATDARSVPGGNDRNAYSRAERDHHEFHDRDWWRQRYPVIVFANFGYYCLDAGYWYPCWGYDQNSDYDNYDGPIYAYNNQTPDQVIADVQSALQQEGYYSGPITGSLDAQTRAALAAYQRDNGLAITGNVDEATVESLGLE
jgi:hypothetical protein